MNKIFTLAICAVFMLQVSALSMGSRPKATKSSSKEAVVKQKIFTSDKNKVKQTKILKELTEENKLKEGSTPSAPETGRDEHPSGQF